MRGGLLRLGWKLQSLDPLPQGDTWLVFLGSIEESPSAESQRSPGCSLTFRARALAFTCTEEEGDNVEASCGDAIATAEDI